MKNALLICIVAVLILSLAGCADPGTARRVLESNGYKNVQITGYQYTGCSDDDTYTTGFIATSPAGVSVTGVVCSDYFKGSTIRFK